MDMTEDGRIGVGSRVLVRCPTGRSPYWDVVRSVFKQQILLEPYARNLEVESLLLTTRSWCRVDDVMQVGPISNVETNHGC